MTGGVRWVRTEGFREDMDVETEYEELRRKGSLTLEHVVDYRELRRRQAEERTAGRNASGLDLDGRGEERNRTRAEFETRISAVIRRAAEDGFAVRVVRDDWGWVREKRGLRRVLGGRLEASKSGREEPPFGKRLRSLDRRILLLDGPLPAEVADPVGAIQARARETYEKLCRDGEVWIPWSSASHALLAERMDVVFFRELERLRAQDGLEVEVEREFEEYEWWRVKGKAAART